MTAAVQGDLFPAHCPVRPHREPVISKSQPTFWVAYYGDDGLCRYHGKPAPCRLCAAVDASFKARAAGKSTFEPIDGDDD